MRKRIIKNFSIIFMFCLVVCKMHVSAEEQRLFDNAGLFTAEQTAELSNHIEQAVQETELDIAVVTTEDADGKTSQEYADDFYDSRNLGNGKAYSGYLFLIDMDNREICISTSGLAIDLLTDDRIESILDAAYEEMVLGNYEAAAAAFLDESVFYINQGIEEGQYRYDVETGKIIRPISWHIKNLISGLVAGAVIAAIVCGVIASKYSAKFKNKTYSYRENGKLTLTCKEDIFINQAVTHRRIPRQTATSGSAGGGSRSSSAGRSSVHHSGSGRTHGGGSRKF